MQRSSVVYRSLAGEGEGAPTRHLRMALLLFGDVLGFVAPTDPSSFPAPAPASARLQRPWPREVGAPDRGAALGVSSWKPFLAEVLVPDGR